MFPGRFCVYFICKDNFIYKKRKKRKSRKGKEFRRSNQIIKLVKEIEVYNTALLHGCILKLLHKYYTVIVEVTNEIRTPFKTRKKQNGG